MTLQEDQGKTQPKDRHLDQGLAAAVDRETFLEMVLEKDQGMEVERGLAMVLEKGQGNCRGIAQGTGREILRFLDRDRDQDRTTGEVIESRGILHHQNEAGDTHDLHHIPEIEEVAVGSPVTERLLVPIDASGSLVSVSTQRKDRNTGKKKYETF